MKNTKICPYCGEEVPVDAVKCSHCKEWLTPEANPTTTNKPSAKSSKTWLWIMITVGIIGAITIAFVLLSGKKDNPNNFDNSDCYDFNGSTLTHEKLSWTIPTGFAVIEKDYDDEDNTYSYTISDKNEENILGIYIDKYSEYRDTPIREFSDALTSESLDEFFDAFLEGINEEDGKKHSLSTDYVDSIHYEYRKNINSVSRNFSARLDGERALGYIRYTLTGPYLITTLAFISSVADNSVNESFYSIVSSLINSEYGPSGSTYRFSESQEILDFNWNSTPPPPTPAPEIPVLSDESETEDDIVDDVIPFQLVEQKPSFNGGDANEFNKWVNQNLDYPETAKVNGNQGRVIVGFTIDKEGYLKDVKIIRGLDQDLDAEAIRVVSSSPKWEPGRQDGLPVNVSYIFPVIFQLR